MAGGLVFWTLRQRRYVRILCGMAVVALGCVAAGTFEIHRYGEKRHDNHALLAAAHAAPVALTGSLVPLAPASSDALRFRRVTATGRFVASAQTYVGNNEQGGHQGFYVLTPLRTADGTVLLVARGFVPAAAGTEVRPADVASPPSGVVTVSGRLSPGQTASDDYGVLGHGEVTSINPVRQGARLHAPVYAAWLTLTPSSVGTADLEAIPGPDLSNPSGGAAQWQLLSYVVQWYAFALLALIAPFLFSRAELKEARRHYLGVDDDAEEIDAADPHPELETASETLVRRSGSTALSRVDRDSPRFRQAARLADRYGRVLTTEDSDRDPREPASERRPRRDGAIPHADSATFSPQIVSDSRLTPHRSVDAYQGSYNDYLWQLALADGEVPDSAPARAEEAQAHQPPRVIDVGTDDPPSVP